MSATLAAPSRWRASIEVPAKMRGVASAITLASVAVYALGCGPLPGSFMPWIIAAMALAAVLGFALREPRLAHLGIFTALALGVLRVDALASRWPLPLPITLAAYAAIVLAVPDLRGAASWLRRGTIDKVCWLWTLAFVAASAIALVVWRATTDADLSDLRAFVPDMPFWAIALGIVPFAMLNAAYEEVLWRGVAMHAVESAVGRGALAWLIQGIGFGVWHYNGFPRGWIGVGLATIFALMMGALRMRSRGMLAPFLAHVFADVTIFIMVAAMALGAR